MNLTPFVQTFEIPCYQPGTLSDLRFAVKDLIDIAGFVTGCGNPSWTKTHPPAVSNAISVDQLLSEGATCVGKTITDELAFSLIGENYFFGTPLNPKAPDRVPGGSSSGSASAVASGYVDFALGTDTGGSIRVPASHCGIWGFRPSYGHISVSGVNPLAPSFDTVGVLAKNGEILSKVASVLLGVKPQPLLGEGNVLILEDAFALSDPEIKNILLPMLNHLPKTSLKQISESIDFDFLLNTLCHLQWTEIWSTLGSWIEKAKPELGPHIVKNFALAKNADRTQIQKHRITREIFAQSMNQFLGKNRFLCFPTTPSIAPKLNTIGVDRTTGSFYPRILSLNAMASLGRLPQISIPVSTAEESPISLSLIGSYGNDALLLMLSMLSIFKVHSY